MEDLDDDIGVFDENHAQSHSREILQSGLLNADKNEVERLVTLLHGNFDANFTLIPAIKSLDNEKL